MLAYIGTRLPVAAQEFVHRLPKGAVDETMGPIQHRTRVHPLAFVQSVPDFLRKERIFANDCRLDDVLHDRKVGTKTTALGTFVGDYLKQCLGPMALG